MIVATRRRPQKPALPMIHALFGSVMGAKCDGKLRPGWSLFFPHGMSFHIVEMSPVQIG
jgi:hypothetical protein